MILLSLVLAHASQFGDTCNTGLELAANTTIPGTTVARPTPNLATCGASVSSPGTWYTFIAPSDGVLTLSTCNDATFDSKISVFEGPCNAPVCVDGADDTPECGLTTELDVTVVQGQTYHVLVHGFGTVSGTYNLTTVLTTDEPPIDCSNRDPAVCALVDQLVRSINDTAGQQLVTQSSTSARLRPTQLYRRMAGIVQRANDNQCAIIGTSGGVYLSTDHTWLGNDHHNFFGDAVASGAYTQRPNTWIGAGGFGPYGNRFGLFNGRGKTAASLGTNDNLFAMGVWVRTRGGNGVFANLQGACQVGDYADIFEPWYGSPLPDLITI